MNRRTQLIAALLWILVVLYPNPLMLVATVWRTLSPTIDAESARALAATLPDDPDVIRDKVLNELAMYEYNWYTYDVPWYFPSAKEVIRDRRGDCEGQAILLASILQAKGIPYQLKMSFDHMWVDYAKKKPTEMENDDMAFARRDGNNVKINLPKHFDLANYINIQLDARWHPMPAYRKALLCAGIALIAFGPSLFQQSRRLPPVPAAYTWVGNRAWRRSGQHQG